MIDSTLLEACELFESELKDWWQERRKKGSLVAGELPKQLSLFLERHPEYQRFKDEIEPYYVTVPGSYQPAGCWCCEGSFNFDRAKVSGVKVRPIDWEHYRRLACGTIDRTKLQGSGFTFGKRIDPENAPDLTKTTLKPLKDFKVVYEPMIVVG